MDAGVNSNVSWLSTVCLKQQDPFLKPRVQSGLNLFREKEDTRRREKDTLTR